MKKILLILFVLISVSCQAQFYGLNRNYLVDSCDISPVYYNSDSYYIGNESNYPSTISMSKDGEFMHVLDLVVDSIFQYLLSSTYLVSTATYDTSFYVGGQDGNPTDISFRADGLKMFYCGLGDNIYAYTLSTAWDIRTMTYDNVFFSTSGQTTSLTGISFKTDGTIMYASDAANDSLFQYALSTAWLVSSASYGNKSLYYGDNSTNAKVNLCGDGSVLYLSNGTPKFLFQYALGTDWDISTGVYVDTYLDMGEASITQANGFDINSTEKIIPIVTTQGDLVFMYKY